MEPQDVKMTDKDLRQSMIGNFLRDARIKAGLTQADVAAVLGYSTAQFVSNWERGLSLPPFSCFPKLADCLQVSYAEFSEMFFKYQMMMIEQDKRRVHNLFKEHQKQHKQANS